LQKQRPEIKCNCDKETFQDDFASVQIMPLTDLREAIFEVHLLIDHSAIEIFINEGEYLITAQLFPNGNYSDLTIENLDNATLSLKDFGLNKVESIW